MIKFFRKIRQNLILENKTGKYFKYAIGEIILVVIGILIALSINNWNEKHQAKNKMVSNFQNLIEDLKSNKLQKNHNYKEKIKHLNLQRAAREITQSGIFPTNVLKEMLHQGQVKKATYMTNVAVT